MDASELLSRYNQPAPRYTSYPPVPHWPAADGSLLLRALERSRSPLSVYIHIPFCERLCLYCGCNVVIRRNHSVADPYLAHLISEMDQVKAAHGRVLTQVHWGGGTPTFLDPPQMTRLFEAITARFDLQPGAEISIEIDPRVTSSEHLRVLRSLGFNRLSMGIQDFDPAVQQTIRRVQPYEQTRSLFEEARRLGFDSINADLIYGLPRQNRRSFQKTLALVLELAPDRLSVFSYAHVPSLKRQQKSFEQYLPSEIDKLHLFEDAVGILTAAGYEYIGIDHFARPRDPLVAARENDTLHRNFQGYTTHAETDLIGFGVSAISRVGNTYTQNCRDWHEYAAAIAGGRSPVFRGYVLTADDAARGSVIEAWLCNGRILKDEIERRHGLNFDEYFKDELERLRAFEEDGLVEGRMSRAITATPAGRIFMRAVARVFDAFQPAAVASKAV